LGKKIINDKIFKQSYEFPISNFRYADEFLNHKKHKNHKIFLCSLVSED